MVVPTLCQISVVAWRTAASKKFNADYRERLRDTPVEPRSAIMSDSRTEPSLKARTRPVGFLWSLARDAVQVSAFVAMRKNQVEFQLQHAERTVISERFADMNRLLEHARLVRKGFEECAWIDVSQAREGSHGLTLIGSEAT